MEKKRASRLLELQLMELNDEVAYWEHSQTPVGSVSNVKGVMVRPNRRLKQRARRAGQKIACWVMRHEQTEKITSQNRSGFERR